MHEHALCQAIMFLGIKLWLMAVVMVTFLFIVSWCMARLVIIPPPKGGSGERGGGRERQ